MQAVVQIGNSQYLVSPGDEILVDHNQDVDRVLMTIDGDKVQIGQPEVQGVKIVTKVIDDLVKGEKIRVFKFKAKSRYRKTRGFRAQLTRVKIESIKDK